VREDERVSERVASVEELRRQAKLQGVEPDEAELVGVHEFLAVFLPAVDELSRLLPADASGPVPLGTE
jgi:hypothetical protein